MYIQNLKAENLIYANFRGEFTWVVIDIGAILNMRTEQNTEEEAYLSALFRHYNNFDHRWNTIGGREGTSRCPPLKVLMSRENMFNNIMRTSSNLLLAGSVLKLPPTQPNTSNSSVSAHCSNSPPPAIPANTSQPVVPATANVPNKRSQVGKTKTKTLKRSL